MKSALSVIVMLVLMVSTSAQARAPAAKERMKDIYINQLDCIGEGAGSRRCSGLEGAYSAGGFGDLHEDASDIDPPPPEWPSTYWDDFSVPQPEEILEVASSGVANNIRERRREWDLSDQTGTLRAVRLRHSQRENGVFISQRATVGAGQISYERTTSHPDIYTESFLELEYDNAAGGGLGGEPFDITDGGNYDTMVLHFNKIIASSKYDVGSLPSDSQAYGARICVHAGTSSVHIEPLAPHYYAGGGGCRGFVLESGTNLELPITYLEYFRIGDPFITEYCGLVEQGDFTPEDFYLWFGVTYESACLVEPDLSIFSSMRYLLINIAGADEVQLEAITLEKRR